MHFNSCFLKSLVTCHSRHYCAQGNSVLLNVALSMWCWLAFVALHVLCIQNILCYASRAGSCSFPEQLMLWNCISKAMFLNPGRVQL